MFTCKLSQLWQRVFFGVVCLYLFSTQVTGAQSIEASVTNPAFRAFLPLALQQSKAGGENTAAANIPIRTCYLEIHNMLKPANGELVARSSNNYEIPELILNGNFPRGKLHINLLTPSGAIFSIKPIEITGSSNLVISILPGQIEKWKDSGIYHLSISRERDLCPPMVSSMSFTVVMEIEEIRDRADPEKATGTWRSFRE